MSNSEKQHLRVLHSACMYLVPKLNTFTSNLSQIRESCLRLDVRIAARIDFWQDTDFPLRFIFIRSQPSLDFSLVTPITYQLLSSS